MLFSEIVYGPIHSRRLGTSLGVELMPLEHKLCTFNCVYCECGWNQPVSHPVLPTREEVKAALEEKLSTIHTASADRKNYQLLPFPVTANRLYILIS